MKNKNKTVCLAVSILLSVKCSQKADDFHTWIYQSEPIVCDLQRGFSIEVKVF